MIQGFSEDSSTPVLTGRPLLEQLKVGLLHTVGAVNGLREQSICRTVRPGDEQRMLHLLHGTNHDLSQLYEQSKQLHNELSCTPVNNELDAACDRLQARFQAADRLLAKHFPDWQCARFQDDSDSDDEDERDDDRREEQRRRHDRAEQMKKHLLSAKKMTIKPIEIGRPEAITSTNQTRPSCYDPIRIGEMVNKPSIATTSEFVMPKGPPLATIKTTKYQAESMDADQTFECGPNSTFVNDQPKILNRPYLPTVTTATAALDKVSLNARPPYSLSSMRSGSTIDSYSLPVSAPTQKPNMAELSKKLENLNRKMAARTEDTSDLNLKYQFSMEASNKWESGAHKLLDLPPRSNTRITPDKQQSTDYEEIEFTPGLSTKIPKKRSFTKASMPKYVEDSPTKYMINSLSDAPKTPPATKPLLTATGVCKTPEMPQINFTVFSNF
jgi:hypothetical protein